MLIKIKTCPACGEPFAINPKGKGAKYCPACSRRRKNYLRSKVGFFQHCFEKILDCPCNTPMKDCLSQAEWEKVQEYMHEL